MNPVSIILSCFLKIHFNIQKNILSWQGYLKKCSSHLWGPQPPIQWILGLFPSGKAAGVWCWLPTSIYPLTLRMSRTIPLLPLCAFMVWAGTSLLYFCIMLPFMSRLPKLFLSVMFPHQNTICTYSLPYICYMPYPSHSSWFHHFDKIWRGVQIRKLFSIWFSPAFCYFFHLRPIHLPQHPILECLQPMLFPKY